MLKFINLTPHDVVLVKANGTTMVFKPEGLARVSVKPRLNALGYIDEDTPIELFVNDYGEVEGLPEPKDDTFYIVSALVMNASPRRDLVVPNDTVRDEAGRIIGCKSFARK